MKAIVLDGFGKENFEVGEVPVPEIDEDEVLIKVSHAGIGQWDIFEREGGYHEMLDIEARFPYILGSEGSGEVVEIGRGVSEVGAGDLVYACSFLNSSGGFYAEYVAVHKDYVRKLPPNLTMVEGAAILGAGVTALRGLDTLQLSSEDDIIVHGASGGVGHIVIQLAGNICNSVLAVASGEDGVKFCEGFEVRSINGKNNDPIRNISHYNRLLMTAPMEEFKKNVRKMRKPATVTYPVGNYEVPESAEEDVSIQPYYGNPDKKIIDRFDEHVKSHDIKCHVDSVFEMDDFKAAHTALEDHYLGKLAFKISR